MRSILGRMSRKFAFYLSFASCPECLWRLFLVKSCLNKINGEVAVIRNAVLLIKQSSGGERGCVGTPLHPNVPPGRWRGHLGQSDMFYIQYSSAPVTSRYYNLFHLCYSSSIQYLSLHILYSRGGELLCHV